MSQPALRLVFRSSRALCSCGHDAPSFFHNSRRSVSTLTPRTPRQRNSIPATLHPQSLTSKKSPLLRALSTTSPRAATTVTLNPRTDDDGTTLQITISEKAARRLKQITSSPQQRNTLAKATVTPDSHLRVTVTSGGCHGFQYLMSLEPADKIDADEDTVFTTEDGGDKGRAQVVMDQPSLELLNGSTVDFVTELIGSQFKIVGNPRASSSCGCGTSFDIQ